MYKGYGLDSQKNLSNFILNKLKIKFQSNKIFTLSNTIFF